MRNSRYSTFSWYIIFSTPPSGSTILATLLNRSEPMSIVAIARYNVCILCHMVCEFVCMVFYCAKIGKIIGKNYIWKCMRTVRSRRARCCFKSAGL